VGGKTKNMNIEKLLEEAFEAGSNWYEDNEDRIRFGNHINPKDFKQWYTEQNLNKHLVMQAEGADVSEGAAVGQRSVDTNAEAREIIAECKRRVDCLCGLECKLTIEEVRSSREGHL
jgi:hypothetical protein